MPMPSRTAAPSPSPASRALRATALLCAAVVVFAVALIGSRPDRARAAATQRVRPVLAPDAFLVIPARPAPRGTHAAEARVVQLGLPRPRRRRVGTAAQAVAEWLAAWHQRAWGRMRLWSTPTPAAPMRAADLRARFWVARLDGATIRRITQHAGHAAVTVLAAVHPALRAGEHRVTLAVPVRRTGGVWQVQADAVATPFAGAMA